MASKIVVVNPEDQEWVISPKVQNVVKGLINFGEYPRKKQVIVVEVLEVEE